MLNGTRGILFFFGPSYAARHEKDREREKDKESEQRDQEWRYDKLRKERNRELLEQTLENVTDVSDRLAIRILLMEEEKKKRKKRGSTVSK